jgi:Putative restriction endonuclease
VSVYKYLAELGSQRPYQLVFGVPRRIPLPPAPEVPAILDRLMPYLCVSRGAGAYSYAAIRAPVDVVLDSENGLVLHPAIAVVRDAEGVVRAERQIWRAPALVVEVLWPASARRIRTATLRWYRNYGVEECWLVDMRCARIEVLDFVHGPRFVPLIYRGKERIQSHVYPDSNIRPVDLFAGIATSWDIRRRSQGASGRHSR